VNRDQVDVSSSANQSCGSKAHYSLLAHVNKYRVNNASLESRLHLIPAFLPMLNKEFYCSLNVVPELQFNLALEIKHRNAT
jgi:hypothetical protein